MQQLFSLLANLPDWNIPWAGIGALLAGTGSLLTGIAALKSSQRRGAKDEKAKETVTPDPPRTKS